MPFEDGEPPNTAGADGAGCSVGAPGMMTLALGSATEAEEEAAGMPWEEAAEDDPGDDTPALVSALDGHMNTITDAITTPTAPAIGAQMRSREGEDLRAGENLEPE